MIERYCAFTGHRPRKFPWGYNEADTRCVALKETLAKEIVKLVETGEHLYCGITLFSPDSAG